MTENNAPEKRLLGIHGGNIYRLAERLGVGWDEIIDFSASVNPLGMSEKALSTIKKLMRSLVNYPDPDAVELRMQLGKHLAVEPESILCGNGSTELIYLIIKALAPERVLIPAPTFSEYERAVNTPRKISCLVLWERDGFAIDPERFIAAMSGSDSSATYKTSLTTSVDMAFLCNPNNPTGGLLKRQDVLRIADAARNLKCHLVVDEAFIDFAHEDSVALEVQNNPYLIVLRSMTKFYALAGLRLGYGIFHPSVLETVRNHKEPWTVNNLAQAAGVASIEDISYRKETLRLIRNEKKTVEDGFGILGFRYFESAANYYLLKLDNAGEIRAALEEKGIMVRDCSDFLGLDESYIRVAVKSNRDNMRLLKELMRWRKV